METHALHQLAVGSAGFVMRLLVGLIAVLVGLAALPRTAGPKPAVVPTFDCLSIYWSPEGGAPDRECAVRYRAVGAGPWQEALPLWFDARNREYRGSIVGLRPATAYEIKLRMGRTSRTVTGRTWGERFPVGKTIRLPAVSRRTLVIDQSGTPDGYVVYAPAENKAATIDVAGSEEQCIYIKASYVIVRGLTLKRGGAHGVRIEDGSHDVVIEECDISGWGRVEPDGWGHDYDAAVFAEGSGVKRVIIQRNRMHHPRSDANSWREHRDTGDDGGWHPEGPQAVTFFSTGGNHAIRYNEVYSDEEHRFNDCLGGGDNFSYEGFPNRDSDIYGNKLSHCWDDAIESEGANCNVRIWGNYIDDTFVKIAIAGTSLGPLYIFRNIAAASRYAPFGSSDEDDRGPFLKAGGQGQYNGGRVYLFHNMLLQPAPPGGALFPLGCNIGLSSYGGRMLNVVSRNNILQVHREEAASIEDSRASPTNSFDYDLYNGRVEAFGAQETHGIRGAPVYDPSRAPGCFWLAPSSPGRDAGLRIPDFNDDFTGAGPDIGAHEAGSPPMEFGVEAYRHSL